MISISRIRAKTAVTAVTFNCTSDQVFVICRYVDLLLGEFKHYKTRLDHGGISKEVSVRELINSSLSFFLPLSFDLTLFFFILVLSNELTRVCSASS